MTQKYPAGHSIQNSLVILRLNSSLELLIFLATSTPLTSLHPMAVWTRVYASYLSIFKELRSFHAKHLAGKNRTENRIHRSLTQHRTGFGSSELACCSRLPSMLVIIDGRSDTGRPNELKYPNCSARIFLNGAIDILKLFFLSKMINLNNIFFKSQFRFIFRLQSHEVI